MKLNLIELGIEVTRRCNQKCEGYCMRGPIQNIDLTDIGLIDHIFESNDFGYISSINFSGGEPTLNPDIIVYTINKIIENNIPVHKVIMVTNGLKYSQEIVEAFNRFNEYRNALVHKSIRENYVGMDEETVNDLLKMNTDEHARITFSADQFHRPLKQEIKEAYYRDGKGIYFTETGQKKEEDINQSGYSNMGKEIDYSEPLRIMQDGKNSVFLAGTIYVTATGYYVIGGDGEYTEMDKINCGHITDVTIHDVVANYGTTKDDKVQAIIESWKSQYQSDNSSKRL